MGELFFSLYCFVFVASQPQKGKTSSLEETSEFAPVWTLYNTALTDIENEQWHTALKNLDSSLIYLARLKVADTLKTRKSEFHALLLEEYEVL